MKVDVRTRFVFSTHLFLLCIYMTVTHNTFKEIKHKPSEDLEFCRCILDSATVIQSCVTFSPLGVGR